MRSKTLVFGWCFTALALLANAFAFAVDPAFVGKLALLADPEVAKELGLSDDTKKKLADLINQREQEATALVAKIKSLPAAKQAEQLAALRGRVRKAG